MTGTNELRIAGLPITSTYQNTGVNMCLGYGQHDIFSVAIRMLNGINTGMTFRTPLGGLLAQ